MTSWIEAGSAHTDLIIVRHGKAEFDSPTGLDHDRPLREKGHRQAAWLGAALADMNLGGAGVGGAELVASAAVRARETAEGIDAVLDLGIAFDDRLLVDRPASDVVDLIGARLRGVGVLILVGHNPQVSRLAMLAGGAIVSSGVALRTGEAACIRFAEGEVFGEGTMEHVLRMPKGAS